MTLTVDVLLIDGPYDLQKLTEEEQKLFRLYGKLPTHKNVLTKMQKVFSRFRILCLSGV